MADDEPDSRDSPGASGRTASLTRAVKSLDDKLDAAALRAVSVVPNDAQSQRPAGEKLPAFRRAVEATKQADYAEGDWLVLAFGVGLKTISPLISQDKYASDVQSFVLETLLVRDPDSLTWHGQLASDWTVSDDGLTITLVSDLKLAFPTVSRCERKTWRSAIRSS